MKILAIMGSSRKKRNSFMAMEVVRQNLEEKGDVEVEYVYLADAKLGVCRGCENCMSLGEDKCPFRNDDVAVIKEKIIKADAIVFVSSVFSYQVSTIAKVFIDRLAYMFDTPMMQKKVGLAIAVGGQVCPYVADYIEDIFYAWGFAKVFKAAVQGFEFINDNVKQKQIKQLNKISDDFYIYIKNKVPENITFNKLMSFNILKLYTIETGFRGLKYSAEYWKKNGWLDADTEYYYEANINPLYKLVIFLIRPIIKNVIRSNFKKITV